MLAAKTELEGREWALQDALKTKQQLEERLRQQARRGAAGRVGWRVVYVLLGLNTAEQGREGGIMARGRARHSFGQR